MPAPPTVIITSCQNSANPLIDIGGVDSACGLQIVLVTNDQAARPSQAWIEPQTTLHRVSLGCLNPLDQHVEALIEGVMLSATSRGWIWVPSDTPMMRWATVMAVAEGLKSNPLVHAEHGQEAGIPLGVGAELFSELLKLSSHRDLQRFRSRYPAMSVSVNDPGVTMSEAGRLQCSSALRTMQKSPAEPGFKSGR